jgi:hypothetical protein
MDRKIKGPRYNRKQLILYTSLGPSRSNLQNGEKIGLVPFPAPCTRRNRGTREMPCPVLRNTLENDGVHFES